MQPTNPKMEHGANVASFVKLAYLFVGAASLVYFLLSMHDGGTLAAAATQASLGLLQGVAVLIVVFGLVIVGSALRHPARQVASQVRRRS